MPAPIRARHRPVLADVLEHLRTPLYRNAYALMASNLLTSALGVAYWTLAARLYGAEQLGLSSALISTMLFLTGVAQLNLRVALVRLVPEAGAATGRLVRSAYAATLLATGLLAALALPLLGRFVPGSERFAAEAGPAFGIGFVIATMSWSLFNLQDGVLAGLRRTLWVPLENVLYGIAKIAVLVGIAASLPLMGIVTSWFVPMVVAVGAVSVALAFRWIPAHERRDAGRTLTLPRAALLRFIASDYVASLFALAVTTLLPVLVVSRLGAETGAYFYIVWIVATSLNLIPINMAASLTVETVTARADLGSGIRRVLVHMMRLLVPLALGVAVVAPWLLALFGPAYAASGTDALRVLALAVVPHAVVIAALAAARIQSRGREIIVIQAVTAVGALTGSLLLLDPMGVTGVALAWLASQTIGAIILFVIRMRPLIRSGLPA